MTYTATEIVLIIGAFGAMGSQLLSAWRLGAKTDRLVATTDEIHALTNSTASRLRESLDLMAEKVHGLESLLAQLRQEKSAVLAARTASDLQVQQARSEMPPTHP